MRKIITAALAALTVGGAMVATAAPASAQGRYEGSRYRDNDRRHDDNGTAIVAGIAGLAIGAALASSHNNSAPAYGYNGYSQSYAPNYGSNYGYDSGYNRGSAYGGYRTCERRERVYDRYQRRNVVVTTQYAC
jgi:hypothetical protein